MRWVGEKHTDEREQCRGKKQTDKREQLGVGEGRDSHKGDSWKTHALVECLSKNIRERAVCVRKADGRERATQRGREEKHMRETTGKLMNSCGDLRKKKKVVC